LIQGGVCAARRKGETIEAVGADKALGRICGWQKEGDRLNNCRTVANETYGGRQGRNSAVEAPGLFCRTLTQDFCRGAPSKESVLLTEEKTCCTA
jgi:hypothetical protein